MDIHAVDCDLGDDCSCLPVSSPPDGDLELAEGDGPLDLAALFDAIPMHVEIDPTVDLDADDPALVASSGRRQCISSRRAGGRCTVTAPRRELLCAAHSGKLDPAEGGKAKARKHRESLQDTEEEARLGRLGTRGAIAARLVQRTSSVLKAVDLLLDGAEQGDRESAKLLLPYMNQALGTPTETVRTTVDVGSTAELDQLSDEQLRALRDEKKAALRLVESDRDADAA